MGGGADECNSEFRRMVNGDGGVWSARRLLRPHGEDRTFDSGDLVPVKMPVGAVQKEFRLFVQTKLGFGANAARKRHVQALEVAGRRYKGKLQDPCLPTGAEDVWARSLVQSTRANQKLVLVGTGDYRKCEKMLQPLIHETGKDCGGNACAMDGTPPFPNAMEVLGFSEFWYSMYDVFGLKGNYDPVEFASVATQFCSRDWVGLQKEYKTGKYPKAKPDRFLNQCFKAAWMATMLEKVPTHQPHHQCMLWLRLPIFFFFSPFSSY